MNHTNKRRLSLSIVFIFLFFGIHAQKRNDCNSILYEKKIDGLPEKIYVWQDTFSYSFLQSSEKEKKINAYQSWWTKHPKCEWMDKYYMQKTDLIIQVPIRVLPSSALKAIQYFHLSLLADSCSQWDSIFSAIIDSDTIVFFDSKADLGFRAIRMLDTLNFKHFIDNEVKPDFDGEIDTIYFQKQALEIQNLYLVGNDTLKLQAICPKVADITLTNGLYLANNQLSSLPKNIGKLPIKILDISYNQFEILPNQIANMYFLAEIDLRGNDKLNLRQAINVLLQLPKLKKMYVTHYQKTIIKQKYPILLRKINKKKIELTEK